MTCLRLRESLVTQHTTLSPTKTLFGPVVLWLQERQVRSKFEVEKHLQGQTVICKRQNDAPDLLTRSPVRREMSRAFA